MLLSVKYTDNLDPAQLNSFGAAAISFKGTLEPRQPTFETFYRNF